MAWLRVHYHSETLRMPVPMEVLLPQYQSGGSRKVDDPGPYPTLYLLHGMSDDHTAWMRRTRIERYVERLPLAVVMPAGHLGWYTDMAKGRNYFTFLTEELPAISERLFPLSSAKEDRFIAGLSMGGYGAMKAGIVAPDVFAAAASFSGALDALEVYDRIGPRLAGDVFGSKEELEGSMNDLFAAAAVMAESGQRCPELYAWCGTEDFLHDANIRFKEHAARLGLPLTYEEGPGNHNWKYWDQCIERILGWLPMREPRVK